MNNKSIKALALLAVFGVSLAGATVQFEKADTKAPTDKEIRKKDIARRLQVAKANGML